MHVCGQNKRLGLLKNMNIREVGKCITVVYSAWWSDRLSTVAHTFADLRSVCPTDDDQLCSSLSVSVSVAHKGPLI